MSFEWSSHKIGELFDLINGFAFKGGDFISQGVPVLKIKNVKPNSVVLNELSYVSSEVASCRADKAVQRGDILITMSGNRFDGSKDTWVGKVAYFDLDGLYMLNQRVGVLRPREGVIIDRKCAAYFLSSDIYQNLFISIATSSGGQANLSPAQILSESIDLPPLSEQRKISKLIGILDDRINLLRETNATLEAIAQALFKSWFVDFDPVHANAHARAQNQNSHSQAAQPNPAPQSAEAIAPNLGLDAATAALFPDHFQDSDLGPIPAGWRVGSLADLAALNPESWTAKNKPEELAYVDLANAKENIIAEVTKYLYEDAPSRARRVLRVGDTIVGTVRPGNKSFAYIGKAEGNLTGSTGFAVLRPLAVENTEFVYLAATSEESIDYLSHVADGGAYPAVRPEVVVGVTTIVPPASCLQAFHELVAPMFSKVAENHEQAQTLTQLRDTLLPRLISGQLRLPDAEAQIEAAVGGE